MQDKNDELYWNMDEIYGNFEYPCKIPGFHILCTTQAIYEKYIYNLCVLFHPKQTEPADNKNHPKKNPILDGCFKEMRFYIQTLGKIPNSMQISANKPC